MVEMAGLQVRAGGGQIGQGGLGEDFGGDIVDRGPGDLMNETDVLVFAWIPRGEMTSRRVISGSTMASRPRRP